MSNNLNNIEDKVMMMNEQAVIKELQTIPGVGKSIAQDLVNIGIKKYLILKIETLSCFTKAVTIIAECNKTAACFMFSVVQCILHQLKNLMLKN